MKPRMQAIVLLLLTGLLWSLGGVMVKTGAGNPIVFSSVRGLFGGLVVFIALKGKPKFSFSKPQIIYAITYCLTLTCFVTSNRLTSAANAILLQYISPIVVAILSYFILKEKLHKFDFVAIAGVLFGMWLLVSNDSAANSTLGDVIAIFGGICFAFVPVMLRLQKGKSALESVLLGNILIFATGIPFYFFDPPQIVNVWPAAVLGIFQIGIGYIIYTKAAKTAKAIDLSIIPSIEAILNPVWVFLVTSEFPGIRAVFGGAVLLGIVVLKSYFSVKWQDE
jgi:drug/metabolite transporter (DMT)-like permease